MSQDIWKKYFVFRSFMYIYIHVQRKKKIKNIIEIYF